VTVVIQLDLPTGPELWWYFGGGYLLLSYLVLGPLLVRGMWSQDAGTYTTRETGVRTADNNIHVYIWVWTFSPLTVPVTAVAYGVYVLRRPLFALLLPKESTWRKS
jgi:hypothetical protein